MEYPKFVTITNIDCEFESLSNQIDARYSLTIPINKNYENIMTYIMMNPSKADKNQSDTTVNTVLNFAAKKLQKKIGKVIVVNLFCLYEPNSTKLKSLLSGISDCEREYSSKKNKTSIDEAIFNSNYIILAWGNVPKGIAAANHNKEVSYVYECIKKHKKLKSVYILKSEKHKNILTVAKRPRHPGRMKIEKYVKCSQLSLKGPFLVVAHND
ncbi:DUF1643 domain-containing protein [Paenibacillus marchantiae]|uniref:DUF1643 domain-containing protein n=1 Tax=Paenibacillus marchantiae TaxID=3026433 RepID=UPI00237C21D3|nr:DUF1643 domain-containing protein [Paenibacillus marchantiae]WDQ30455.1 DUF1643 domain-containing protein [Paenibacillus marchantiae]